MSIKHLPPVKPLSEILVKGAEGGKEFARIVDLLLYHEARRAGRNIRIFNDAAGDYYGLDSFDKSTGYQYKFYPSPLSADHRKQIEQSLEKAIENQKQLKLKKWILVTPNDFTNSATRSDGGDLAWFEGLRIKHSAKFEIEHMGHTKLIALFQQTMYLCLFYYPELIEEWAHLRKTIDSIRKSYDGGLLSTYGYIQFVGMPVYKQETASGIPMEDIYIPLSVIPETSNESDNNIQRTDPTTFLVQGKKCVILGDPGSGKTTLLKFLGISGIHEPLRNRYNVPKDERLPMLVVLRRYAEKLKANEDYQLLDYIIDSMRADFSLPSIDMRFLEYYLENGQAILLFDGLDELPNPQLKQTVRNRICALSKTYPLNTILVTSRIIGYDSFFRFDEEEFAHYKVAKLQMGDIKQFITDWYNVRLKNKREKEDNIQDLIHILEDENRPAIRELAQNPLLLAIITLVHRIEATLPDERGVLYSKCTETLLETWHKWKYKGGEDKNTAKTERRNRRRMEAIAFWMHTSMNDKDQRAIVPYKELKKFLAGYIEDKEKPVDDHPEDLADEFLDFVKKRVGLLIEVGDRQYSFVHLTFQEYLTACYITTTCEKTGASSIWEVIKERCNEPTWHEVIRLLLAKLESIDSQEYLIENILEGKKAYTGITIPVLLGGLLLDGIEPAEKNIKEIIQILLNEGCNVEEAGQLKSITAMLKAIRTKEATNAKDFDTAFRVMWKTCSKEKDCLIPMLLIMGMTETEINDLTGGAIYSENREGASLRLLLTNTATGSDFSLLKHDIEYLGAIQDVLCYYYGMQDIVCVLNTIISNNYKSYTIREFETMFVTLIPEGGTFVFNLYNLLLNYGNLFFEESGVDVSRARARALDRDRNRDRVLALARALTRARALSRARALDRALALTRARDRALARILDRALARDRALDRVLATGFWHEVMSDDEIRNPMLDIICDIFALTPRTHWHEALKIAFLPKVPKRNKFFDVASIKSMEKAFKEKNAGETEAYTAARLLLFDAWLYMIEYYKTPDETRFSDLVKLTHGVDIPVLKIAHCIRDLAYGDESKTNVLVQMVKSDDPRYKEIFEKCYWR